MTYIPVDRILEHIPNKFEAIKVAALECRRLNEKLQAMEDVDDHEEKITTMAVHRLMDGDVRYHDARERREQERSEAMLAAAEEMLDMTAPTAATLAELGGLPEDAEAVEGATPEASAVAPAESAPVEAPAEGTPAEAPAEAAPAVEEPAAELEAEPADELEVEDEVEEAIEMEAEAAEPADAPEAIEEEPKD